MSNVKSDSVNFDNQNGFKGLTPTDSADPNGTYSRALDFAFDNGEILNVAITGPFGCGKSSVIKTYEKKNAAKHRFINISLASFCEKDSDFESDDDQIKNRAIERSILQQMLYGVEAREIPYSRFKRINTPAYPLWKAVLVFAWLASVYCLVVMSDSGFMYSNYYLRIAVYLLWVCFSAGGIFLISELYKSLFRISLKRISLTNTEIETGDLSENSILNRHLDEILYFFQEVDCDVVVIEDLDRFGDPEIFVKLREINRLINNSRKTTNGKTVKFLYALKDDMFMHKDRSKFFDFIIPVIPVINSSNSLDKMNERLATVELPKPIEPQFLREVSLYIDDLRLIHNIFNEFLIYHEQLRSDKLDVTKLLALMIYKNYYPKDFENLHSKKGVFYRVCQSKTVYQRRKMELLQKGVDDIRKKMSEAENEEISDLNMLVKIYIAQIALSFPGPIVLKLGGQHTPINELMSIEALERLRAERNITIVNNWGQQIGTKTFAQIENEVDSINSYLTRKKRIEDKSSLRQMEMIQEILVLEKQMSEIHTVKFSGTIDDNVIADVISDKTEGLKDEGLFLYLIKNDYLDDTYNLYISNFYEGRLTKNDMEYLRTIRVFKRPEPNQTIDNCEEVCVNMREEDFAQEYVLNVTLIDYLLEHRKLNAKHIGDAMRFMSENLNQCERFLNEYLVSGRLIGEFIETLSNVWPGFAIGATKTKQAGEIIALIFKFVNEGYVREKMNENGMFSDYLSKDGALVFASAHQAPVCYSLLKDMGVCFRTLSSIQTNDALLKFAYENNMYETNVENVDCVLRKFAGESADDRRETANFTAICAMKSEWLKNYIAKNISLYVDRVFLQLPKNTKEDETIIKALINQADLTKEQKERVLAKQEHVFDSFDGIPEELWACLLLESKVKTTWKNVLDYLGSESRNEELAGDFIYRNINAYSKLNIDGEEGTKTTSQYEALANVIGTAPTKTGSIQLLIKCIPWWNEKQTMDVLSKLGEPYSDIAAYGTRPKLANNETNRELSKLLVSEKIVSTINDKEDEGFIRFNTWKSPDHDS